EDVVLQRVEADRDSLEAGLAKRPSLWREQGAVRRHGEVAKALDPRQLLDQALDVPPHEGLPSRDADLPHAAGDEDAGEPSDLLERQQLLSLEELEVATEDLLRHAVDTAEVAAVGDRDPQVPKRPAQGIAGCTFAVGGD